MSRKEKENKFRRDLIIEAAENILLSKGFENLSMDEIAREAEFTRPTLYSYFKNRDELILILFLRESLKRWKYLEEAFSKTKTGYDNIQNYGKAYYQYYKNNPEFLKLALFYDNHGMNEKDIRKEILDEFFLPNKPAREYFYNIFTIGKKDGTIRADLNIGWVASYFCISLRAILNEIISFTYYNEDYYFYFLEIFLRGIKGKSK